MNANFQKITPLDLDYFWKNCPLSTDRKRLKTYVLNKRHRREAVDASKIWDVIRNFLCDRDEWEEAEEAYRLCREDESALCLLKQGDKVFFTDCGQTLRYLREQFQLDRDGSAALILRLAENEECCLVGDEVCIAVEAHERYFTAYLEMIVLISKLKKLGGFWSYVWNYDKEKERADGKRENGC